MLKVLTVINHTVTDETLIPKWFSFSPAGMNTLLTLLLSLSQVEKPLLSLYWSPKNQVSLSPMVFTIYTQTAHLAVVKQTLPPRSAYLVEELFAGGAGQDGELQLRVHGCNANIYLPEKRLTLKFRRTLGALSCMKEAKMKATAICVCCRGQLGSLTTK